MTWNYSALQKLHEMYNFMTIKMLWWKKLKKDYMIKNKVLKTS